MGLLSSEKVVDIACGSLHCVVCTGAGSVFSWGDNDEGQIGNDSTTAVPVPSVSSSVGMYTSPAMSVYRGGVGYLRRVRVK